MLPSRSGIGNTKEHSSYILGGLIPFVKSGLNSIECPQLNPLPTPLLHTIFQSPRRRYGSLMSYMALDKCRNLVHNTPSTLILYSINTTLWSYCQRISFYSASALRPPKNAKQQKTLANGPIPPHPYSKLKTQQLISGHRSQWWCSCLPEVLHHPESCCESRETDEFHPLHSYLFGVGALDIWCHSRCLDARNSFTFRCE